MTNQRPARLLVTGSRNWTNRTLIYQALRQAWMDLTKQGFTEVVLIHGGARGADTIAAQIWNSVGLPEEHYPADWATHGRKAGPIRNQLMVDNGADLCLAFIQGESKGTRHCLGLAQKAGIPTRVITQE